MIKNMKPQTLKGFRDFLPVLTIAKVFAIIFGIKSPALAC